MGMLASFQCVRCPFDELRDRKMAPFDELRDRDP